ncbi:MAG: DJ-1/PfpI family protein [Candidatus Omnitrophica bacterium]|nr:DJ-1/PfpI family protein [Candidatus Omnitrophota bacterium]
MKLKKFLFFIILLSLLLYSQDRKVLMIIAFENFRDEEFLIPKNILEKNGIVVDVASLKKGIAKGMLGAKVNVNLTFEEIEVKNYEGVIFVGGTGSQTLFNNSYAIKLAQDFYKNKKIIGAICLAPGILAKSGILRGKKATCYSSTTDILKENGAIYTGKDVEIDGNIVTGNGPEAAEKFAITFLQLIKK